MNQKENWTSQIVHELAGMSIVELLEFWPCWDKAMKQQGLPKWARKFCREAIRLVIEKKIEKLLQRQQRLKDDQMEIDKIKIFPCFEAHPPKPEKMERCEQYFQETGALPSEIVLDIFGNLIDGYTSYLLAKAHGLASVPVRYGRRQIVRAYHREGGKLYTWELPAALLGRVCAGERLIVRTSRGPRAVTVAEVEEYAGQEPEPLRTAIGKPGSLTS